MGTIDRRSFFLSALGLGAAFAIPGYAHEAERVPGGTLARLHKNESILPCKTVGELILNIKVDNSKLYDGLAEAVKKSLQCTPSYR